MSAITRSARSGERKARRDTKLADAWMARNGGIDSNNPFWQNLGNDVDRNDPVELAAYEVVKLDFMDQWRQDHPLQVAASEFEHQSALRETFTPEALATAYEAWGLELTEEYVDDIAAQHGHETREDECITIQLLRGAVEWKNSH